MTAADMMNGRKPPTISARGSFHLETAAKLLILLERVLAVFSKCALKSLHNPTDFDSAIRSEGTETEERRLHRLSGERECPSDKVGRRMWGGNHAPQVARPQTAGTLSGTLGVCQQEN
jgi:hypothetical protein